MNNGKTALITGATSGIGLAFAKRFAGMGYDLIVTGRRKDVIKRISEEITRTTGVRVKVLIADFTEERGISKVVDEIGRDSSIEVLVNNAGYGFEALFQNACAEEHLGMVQTHIEAPVRIVRAALPAMIRARKGTIINVSSLGAYAPGPINSIYGGTKAFLNIFSESIYMEVDRFGIKVQALCPGFTSTDFHDKMGVDEKYKKQIKSWMSPEEVVDCSLRCLEKGRVICIPGRLNRLLYALIKMMPRRLYYYAAKKMSAEYLRD